MLTPTQRQGLLALPAAMMTEMDALGIAYVAKSEVYLAIRYGLEVQVT